MYCIIYRVFSNIFEIVNKTVIKVMHLIMQFNILMTSGLRAANFLIFINQLQAILMKLKATLFF